MSIALVLVRQDLTQVEVPIKHSPEILGRHTDCKIRLPDASVSRQHAEIAFDGDRVSIRDLGSSNGTFVNGKKVPQADLRAGDVVTLGKFVFVLKVNGKPESIDSEEALEDGAVAAAAPSKAVAEASPRAKTLPMTAPTSAPTPKPAPKSMTNSDPDDSSVMDFDFLDEKDSPKL